MYLTNYLECPDFNLNSTLFDEIQTLNWNHLEVTTELNRWVVFKEFVRYSYSNNWKIKSFINRYGVFGKQISCLKNFKIPVHIEKEIAQQVKTFFNTDISPIVRLQVIVGGTIVPLHKDPTREASFIIPIKNHKNSFTRFYQTVCVSTNIGLQDPGDCVLEDQVEIVNPTLINTKMVHSVEFDNIYTEESPRISITAKWKNYKFFSTS